MTKVLRFLAAVALLPCWLLGMYFHWRRAQRGEVKFFLASPLRFVNSEVNGDTWVLATIFWCAVALVFILS